MRKYWVVMVLVPALLLALWGRSYLERVPGDEFADYAKVEDGLYIGRRVNDPPKGTGAVLCLSFQKDPYTAKVHSWDPIVDGAPAPPMEWLRKQVFWVAEQRKAGRQVYVHCDAGMSRSAMVTAAYLMWEHKWGRDKALAFLRKRREVVEPNPVFMQLLLEWEGMLKRGDHAAGSERDDAGPTEMSPCGTPNRPSSPLAPSPAPSRPPKTFSPRSMTTLIYTTRNR